MITCLRRLHSGPRRGHVLAAVLFLLGAQLVGGTLHAATAGHGPTADCQVCLALDRLDHAGIEPALAPPTPPIAAAPAQRPATAPHRAPARFRHARAPPAPPRH